MNVPEQAQPIRRQVTTAVHRLANGILPQENCWCIDKDGSDHNWWCEIDRELVDTQIECDPDDS